VTQTAINTQKFPPHRRRLAVVRAVPHWKKICSTNPLKRLNKEIKHRTDVVGVFPNPAALLRLDGALTAPTRPWFRRPVVATAARTQVGRTGFQPATT